MSAIRLEIETHIVTASATAVRNLAKCVQSANVRIDELVAASLASAETVLSDTERELGVAVVDIGAGTIDLALFLDGQPYKTAVLPVGGNNVTNDVAIGLKTSLQVAEELKIQHGSCDLSSVRSERDDQRRDARRAGRPIDPPHGDLRDHRSPNARDLRDACGPRSEWPAKACFRRASS